MTTDTAKLLSDAFKALREQKPARRTHKARRLSGLTIQGLTSMHQTGNVNLPARPICVDPAGVWQP